MSVPKIVVVLGIAAMSLLQSLEHIFLRDSSVHIDPTPEPFVVTLVQRINMFNEWKEKYEKTYGLPELNHRYYKWSRSQEVVKRHNSKGLSWELETNMFADLSDEEFSAIYLGYNHDPDRVRENIRHLDTFEDLSGTSTDWRQKGAVTSVKHQGSCGSCYAFSAVAALEALHFIKRGSLVDLAAQQVVDCSTPYENKGCNGGLMENTFKYTKDLGIEDLADYPYEGRDGRCRYSSSKVIFKNTGYTDVPKNNFTQLRAALKEQPVSVAIEADQDIFKLYKSGVISSDCDTKIDHGTLLVGYESDYWILKNSWGSSWGEEGYVRVAAGSQNDGAGLCGINSAASYPTLSTDLK